MWQVGTPQIQEPTEFRKQPIRTRYLGYVTGYQPIRDQYFLIRSVPALSPIYLLTVSVSGPRISFLVSSLNMNLLCFVHRFDGLFEIVLRLDLVQDLEGMFMLDLCYFVGTML